MHLLTHCCKEKKIKNMEQGQSITRESILKLMESKDEIEAQLRELKEILDGNNVGMSEPLIDREGYPRQDIDVYQVRQARHKIICLQNDHKSLMKEIEKGLHFLHSQSNGTASNSDAITSCTEQTGRPFAKIVHVNENSPAHLAGLQLGDLVVSFGTVNNENFKSMTDIASIVQHSVGRNIIVVIKRDNISKKILLIPKEWKGKGLLGCVIVGLDNIER